MLKNKKEKYMTRSYMPRKNPPQLERPDEAKWVDESWHEDQEGDDYELHAYRARGDGAGYVQRDHSCIQHSIFTTSAYEPIMRRTRGRMRWIKESDEKARWHRSDLTREKFAERDNDASLKHSVGKIDSLSCLNISSHRAHKKLLCARVSLLLAGSLRIVMTKAF